MLYDHGTCMYHGHSEVVAGSRGKTCQESRGADLAHKKMKDVSELFARLIEFSIMCMTFRWEKLIAKYFRVYDATSSDPLVVQTDY